MYIYYTTLTSTFPTPNDANKNIVNLLAILIGFSIWLNFTTNKKSFSLHKKYMLLNKWLILLLSKDLINERKYVVYT
jgi:hypothetical protein